MTIQSKSLLFGCLGAAAGGVAGYFGFFWMLRQGFFSPILPGAMLGLGAGVSTRHRFPLLAYVCGVAALVLGLFTQWRFAGLEGFGDYLLHVYAEPPVTLIMIALGGFFGYRFALGWGRKPAVAPQEQETNSASQL